MHNLDRIFEAYKLKQVNRNTNVLARKESTAEHVFSSLILAQYFLKKIKGLDENKVMKLLLYHDLVEVYAGDKYTFDEEELKKKEKDEEKAAEKLLQTLPQELVSDFQLSWAEWRKGSSKEVKFCRAIDVLDPAINELERPEAWKKFGYTENKFRDTKKGFIAEFPEMVAFMEEMIVELKKRGIIVPKN
jgi:putative hydrolase of HD superfamily